jgi:hypothetical protein
MSKATTGVSIGERDETGRIRIWPLDPRMAAVFRTVCDGLGLAEHCPYRPCRRARRCSTRHVLCWQENRDLINPLIQDAMRARRAAGGLEEPGLAGAGEAPEPATPAPRRGRLSRPGKSS